MRRVKYSIALLFAMFLIVGFSLAALADSPHFISEGTASITSSGAYQVANFKEAGLGNTTTTEKITLSGTATAVFVCVNKGGANPSASNKTTTTGKVSQTQNFSVRNGQTTGTISVGPPEPPAGFSCPSGQTEKLASVSYTGMELIGLAGDTSIEPDLSSGCLLPNVRGAC